MCLHGPYPPDGGLSKYTPRTEERNKMNFRLLRCIGRLSALVGAAVTLTCGADRITIAGSTTVQPIVEAAAKQYMERNPGVEIVVDGGGSGKGIKAVANGDVQIGMSSRALESAELQNGHLVPHKIGMDGLVFLVNTANPVVNLTRQKNLLMVIDDMRGERGPGLIAPFPMSRRHSRTGAALQGAGRKFLDFLCGPEGQEIVGKLDYIPVARK